jgi:hypothetical protein
MKLSHKIGSIGAAAGALLLPLVSKAGSGIGSLGLEVATTTGLGSTDIRQTVASIINVALGLLGIIVVVIIIYGGFLWMTAGGEQEQVEKAGKFIKNGVIGLVIILCAYALAQFIVGSLLKATTSP